MSSIAVTGSATGTGVISLLAPVTNTNRTINLPDSNGTIVTSATAGVPIGGPAFSVYATANTAMSPGVFTKVPYNTEVFDTNSCFDSATNYRFTPTVAGYYQSTGYVTFTTPQGTTETSVTIFKNGAAFKQLVDAVSSAYTYGGSALMYLNGSTDYIELYAYTNNASTRTINSNAVYTYFQAAMVRSAV